MIARLRFEAKQPIPCFKESTITPTASPGVFQSSNLIPSGLKKEFLKHFNSFMDSIPLNERDFHPGTDNKVLNLVHPSLYPFVQDRTPVLSIKRLDDICSKPFSLSSSIESRLQARSSHPKELLISALEEKGVGWDWEPRETQVKFQWLPTDFTVGHRDITVSSKSNVKFHSYINNLHPEIKESKALYPILERVLARFIPLFEKVLNESPLKPMIEEVPESWSFDPPKSEWTPGNFDEKLEEWKGTVKFIPPKIEPFKEPESASISLQGRHLQVIVKMASVELTPDKPEYEGGSWHVEGEFDGCDT